MPVFQYEALDSNGQEVKGQVDALSGEEALSKIRNMGYFPTKPPKPKGGAREKKAGSSKPKSRRGAGGSVKVKQLTQFARQLSTLQDAGLPILRSLRILEEQQKPGTFKRVIGYVADDIEGGATLSEALGKFPKAFNRLFVNMVAAGEVGGVLDVILARLADFMEKAQKLKAKIKGAMVYPIVVMGAAFGIVMGLMLGVIPKFSEVLKEMTGGELPGLTRGLMATSDWIAFKYGWAVLIAIPFIWIMALRLIRQFPTGRLVMDLIYLKMPVIGQLVYKTGVARWTRTLGTLISAGVPILEAINITAETSGSEVYSNMLRKVHNAIRQGDTFANPLRQTKTVDGLVVNMIDVGEETGDMDKMLIKIANNFDEEIDVLVGSLMSLLEPIMILVLGAIVGVIVLAIFLPMVKIITSLM
ncbi:MAG TPA: pilus assembly protein PilC [Phycisphaerales bacterium]|nr:MAG: pilus assembly protein PilC [Planctomycetes bacterium GWC2_45_44]HBG78056.1 pilus assembly protein PilC [Phycisphaerales bacterium]HBR20113.1 pilus assembly protein PilC [Phycisphaerales bacterium]